MNFGTYEFGWFDLLLLILLGVGITRGRKRGMSEEFPNLIQWVVILAGGALLHRPLGGLLSNATGLGKLGGYLFVYVSWAMLVKMITVWIVRSMGDRLQLSNTFGNAEYYLGMISGMFRYGMVILFSLALLNARQYSAKEVKSMAEFQQDNYGSISFPTVSSVQTSVFRQSVTGKLAKEYLSPVMVQPAGAGSGSRTATRRTY